jgi:hypothetical protein
MTKHALVKKGIVENKDGNAKCTCEKVETRCKENGLPALRKRYAKRRKTMMDKLKMLARIQTCFIDNLEPDEKGCYPDWSATSAGKYKYYYYCAHQYEALRPVMALLQALNPASKFDTTVRVAYDLKPSMITSWMCMICKQNGRVRRRALALLRGGVSPLQI